MAADVPHADGYVVCNYFVPLQRGLRFEDGLTFDGRVTAHGGELLLTPPTKWESTAALPLPNSPMSGRIRARFIRTEAPAADAIQMDEFFPRAVAALGRPAVEGGVKTSAIVGNAINTVAQIQVSSPCKLGSTRSTATAVNETFDWGLDVLREIQYRYREATRTIAVLATRENIPPVLTMNRVTYDLTGTVFEDPGMGIFSPGSMGLAELELSNINDDEQWQIIAKLWDRSNNTLFQRFNDFGLDSREAMWMAGDYRGVVLNAAIACECLLDDVLCYLLWWEGLSPQQAKPALVKPTYKKVASEFGPRIGGLWSPTRRGPINNWHRRVARVRDRIVHGGYQPSREEASHALDAMLGLRHLLGRLVVSKKSQQRFPHLPILLLGPAIASAQELDLSPAREWYESDLHYQERLNNWRAVTRRLRVEHFSDEGTVSPDSDQCVVWTIVDRNAIRHFAVDQSFALAAEVNMLHMRNAELDRLRAIQDGLEEGRWEVLQLVEFGTRSRARVSDHWLPLEDVMPEFPLDPPRQQVSQ